MKTIPGGMSADIFLRDYWQKQPLLIRQAFPGFDGFMTPDELAGLACEEEAQSRLVMFSKGKWKVEHGPFDESRYAKLPDKGWALLVQGVNHFLPEATDLLQQFSFIPTARLDDLMVSFAPDGGGVGPHFDSYDVFLIQGSGQRLWRISDQQDQSLVEGAPLRILQRFDACQEWILNSGDMLYLPPRYAHWGIALGDCMTYSVGFRAPSAQELGAQFLAYLQESLELQGMYADPDLEYQVHPAEISWQAVSKVAEMLSAMTWDNNDVIDFLGCYLTEPKPHVVFKPLRAMNKERFTAKLLQQGIRLTLQSQMLFHEGKFFINGEKIVAGLKALPALCELADKRYCRVGDPDEELIEQLYTWYRAAYINF
jgi:50S ribosomal protein L16 3-hydroxylase